MSNLQSHLPYPRYSGKYSGQNPNHFAWNTEFKKPKPWWMSFLKFNLRMIGENQKECTSISSRSCAEPQKETENWNSQGRRGNMYSSVGKSAARTISIFKT